MKIFSISLIVGAVAFAGCFAKKEHKAAFVATPVSFIKASFKTVGPTAETEVTWLSFSEAMEKSKSKKLPIFIDVYTDWCGWCKVMDKKTFSDPEVAKLLNEKFYAVKFNAEQTQDVIFKGTTYKFVASGRSGYHEFAAALLNNKLSYPTVVFLNEDYDMISPVAGFREAPEFHMLAKFIGDGHYKTMKFEDWKKDYKSPYSPKP